MAGRSTHRSVTMGRTVSGPKSIENLWHNVERMLGGRKFKREQDLFDAIAVAWSKIPNERLHKLIESMPRRCKHVIESKGYSTKY